MPKPQDPYEILGLPKDASPEAIKSAYRKLAKKHHPDLNPSDAAAADRFAAIGNAYALLSDPQTRARFDRGEIDASGAEKPPPNWRDYADTPQGNAYSGTSHIDPEDLQDIFASMFGHGTRPGAGAGGIKMRGPDQHFELTLGFFDAVNGSTQSLRLPDGRSIDVRIPPGAAEGRVVRLRGQGGPGLGGGPPGDALITLHVTPHPTLRREGQDLCMELPIGLETAVLGGKAEVPTAGGPVRLTIPPGADSGQELRLRGRGVPAHGSHPAGDVRVKLVVQLGAVDAELADFLRARRARGGGA